MLLTQRTAHLKDHAGQVSFPGGRSEADDADAVDTALREAHEEIGLERGHVDVVGFLPVYTTVTSFEVAEVFEVPLSFLMTPAHHRRHVVEIDGLRRQFLSMPWAPPPEASGQARSYFIWGATAAILRNFYRLLVA